MSWPAAPSASDLQSEFTPDEIALITDLQGGMSNLSVLVARAVAEVRDAIRAGNYDLDVDGTLPLGLHSDCIAIARWRYLLTLPDAAKSFQTEGRKAAYEAAQKKLGMISNMDWAVEPPAPLGETRFGNWNSENKILSRTNPAPRPGTQYSPASGQYANPDAPADNS